ncbi:Inner membrane protein YnbA [compost metagenome]
MAGLMGKVVGTARRYDGPMGKSDRALLVGLYGILAFCQVSLQNSSLYIFAIINMLLIISTLTRLRKSLI